VDEEDGQEEGEGTRRDQFHEPAESAQERVEQAGAVGGQIGQGLVPQAGECARADPERRAPEPLLDPVEAAAELACQLRPLPRHRVAHEGEKSEQDEQAADQGDGDAERPWQEAVQQVGRGAQDRGDDQGQEDGHGDELEAAEDGEGAVDGDADEDDPPGVGGGDAQPGDRALRLRDGGSGPGARRKAYGVRRAAAQHGAARPAPAAPPGHRTARIRHRASRC
jgi:hypothetical protein